MKHPSPAVVVIIGLNIALFVLTFWVFGGPVKTPKVYDLLALHFPLSPHQHGWQYVTHMFMHGGSTHILFNMIGLYTFGMHLERIWGTLRFVVFYFLSGIGAAVIFSGVNFYEFNNLKEELNETGVTDAQIVDYLEVHGTPIKGTNSYLVSSNPQLAELGSIYHTPMVGASGALYGVLVAFAMLWPNAKLFLLFIPVPVAAKYVVPTLLLVDLFSGLTGFSLFGGGIAHFAHIGGAIIGFGLMWYWRDQLRPKYRDYYTRGGGFF